MEEKVTLYVYDISAGMAKSFGKMFTGRDIEAVYHTSVMVYGNEFLYQGGISCEKPKSTAFGQPIKELPMGTTEISQSEFKEYLDSIKGVFAPEKYDIFDQNCNHFSNAVCEFLVGTGIPSEILNQAKDFKGTPIGNLIGGMQKNITAQAAPPAFPGVNFNNLFPPTQGATAPQPTASHSKNVLELTAIEDYLSVTDTSKKIIIDFNADWCGPCRNIKPLFNSLADSNPSVKFVSVNVDNAPDISQNLGIQAMPTFVAIHNGAEIDRLQGADPTRLKQMVEKLSKLN